VADLAVLDRDFFSVPDEEIKEIKVEKTMVAGNFVWECEG
jgi:predicted amidohydrolase YtcJ